MWLGRSPDIANLIRFVSLRPSDVLSEAFPLVILFLRENSLEPKQYEGQAVKAVSEVDAKLWDDLWLSRAVPSTR